MAYRRVSSMTCEKLLGLAVALTIVAFFHATEARPNDKKSSTVLHSQQKAKRTWDSPYASDAQEDPVISVVDEGDARGDGNDPAGAAPLDTMWLDIGKNFQESREIVVNMDGELECEAVGSPPPRVFWLKNGVPIESITTVTNDDSVKNRVELGHNALYDKYGHTGMANVKSKLPVKCAQPEDQAVYTCVAANRGKQVSANTQLNVIAAADEGTSKVSRGSCEFRQALFSFKKSKKGSSAIIVTSETFHMETMGRHIALPCRAVGKPRPQVYWTDQDGKKIVSGKKYQVSSSGSLVIRNLVWKDMGVYSCFAENSFGRDSTTTFVYPLLEESDES